MPDRVRVHTMHSAQGRDLEPIFGYLSQSKIFSANFRQTWTTVLVTMYGFHSEKKWKKIYIHMKYYNFIQFCFLLAAPTSTPQVAV